MITPQHPDQWSALKIAASSDAGRERAESRAREFLSTYGLFNAYSKAEEYSGTIFLDNGNLLLDPEVVVMVREGQRGLPFLGCENERINLGPHGTGLVWTPGNCSPLYVRAGSIEGSSVSLPEALRSSDRTLSRTYFPRLSIRRGEHTDHMYGDAFDNLALGYASKERIVLRTSSGALIDIPR